jgi:gamma-glutamyltranspeptidase/glutathione hydrolase
VFLRGSACPGPARLWTNRDLGAALQALARADRRHRRRDSGLRAAHDEFYRGAIARRIDRFCRSTAVPDGTGRAHAGLLRYDDLATYQAVLEEPLSVAYRGWRVLKCHAWTQGPVLLQSLNLLEGFDLPALRHNSAAYIHAVVECMKLAFADREFYYGDPAMAKVPIRRLLSKAYAARRRGLVDEAAASSELRPGDRPAIAAGDIRDVERAIAQGRARTAACSTGDPPSGPAGGDTTAVQAVDREGNIVSAVTSGGWLQSSPVIPGLGFPLGTRGQMFSLVEAHPNALAALKRPRTTLTPALAGLARRPPHLAFSSPGGDNQDQWGLQFLLNVIELGMSLQEAVEAPTFWTRHFPGSFHPRTAEPLRLYVESRVPQTVLDELAARGHRLSAQGPWSGGNTLAVAIDRAGGVLFGAASPRHNPAYAAGR